MTTGLLSDKVALVTGAASGIGRTIATVFAEQGAHVVVADLLLDDGQEALGEFFRDHNVQLVASLPCYLEENVDGQRG